MTVLPSASLPGSASLATPYRTHTCGALTAQDVGLSITLAGWLHRKRDHGQLLFIDLRDHYGLTQCVLDKGGNITVEMFTLAEGLSNESVIQITGTVVQRSPETINTKMSTGEIEIQVQTLTVLSAAAPLPMNINGDQDFPEETRLTYRFLDLRRETLHRNIVLRCNVIAAMRRLMTARGFMEIQTPILTSSSPEGARDYLVPSRLHPGHFYALPQAPQQFKQLLMVSGFDRYFQIAPCFRDEDARADRSPGEFYQLDIEMAFVTQEDVFNVIEPVLRDLFQEFAEGRHVDRDPFPRIAFADAMRWYGNDKPDLRNPIRIADVSHVFADSSFKIFANAVANGNCVRAIPAPGAAACPRSFFDKLNSWAQDKGMPGLGYIVFDQQEGNPPEAKGPIAKFLDAERLAQLQHAAQVTTGDAVFFVCAEEKIAAKNAGLARTEIGKELGLIDETCFKFCWIVDFPMYERDEQTGKIDFSHNPFSMPQGGLEALMTQDPLTIKAYQYDIVCNGIELSSGAIRNHLPDVMYKAFEIVGYSREDVDARFSGMINAFKFGAPPHGGSAPGVDRIVMLLAGQPNIREVIPFPLNQQAQDLMMQAPSPTTTERLKELHLQVIQPVTLKTVKV